jgi:Bul1 C terminus
LHLPPTVGNWDNSDDLSPDMYTHPGPRGTNGRSKIEYKIRVKVITKVAGKKILVEEASEPLQVLPLYSWWENRHPGTPTYEEVQSSSGEATSTPSLKTTRVEKMLKKGFLGKKRGLLSVGIECPESYEVSVGGSEPVKTALSIPIAMQYSPITADLPPKISLLSAKLLARTNFNVDSSHNRRNKGVYSTGVTLLKPSTPSTSTPLWLEDCSSGNLTFISNLLVPISLLPAAGTKTAKGEKVLLPSFESCLISRSYEIEVRIGFEGGNDVMARVPVSIRAKPPTAEAERDLENAIRTANDWVPPEHDAMVGTIEPELLRPTIQTLRLNDSSTSDDDSASINSGAQEPPPVVRTIQLPVGLPPDYEILVSSRNDKEIVEKRITARAA